MVAKLFFSHITAMHSEFLLVEKGTGILYHWPHYSNVACDIAMEISLSQEPTYLPLAKPHPLGEALGLDSEEVCLLSSSNVRCSLVTASGKICTFYDKLLRESNCGDPPALIQELSHPTLSFPELKGEKVLSISCRDFFTSLMTQSGKVFWWGLLPAEERQHFKQKLNKATNESNHISVDEKVQLRQHFPGFPGALVYKCCDIRGPLVGRLICHESPEGTSTVVTKIKVEPLNVKRVDSSETLPSKESTLESTLKGRTVEEELISRHKDVGRSSSPHTSVRRKAQISNKPTNGSEIWEVKDVVFLESENKLLGTVAAIDGPHVIVKVANVMSPTESSLRVFKISELESVPSEGENSEGPPVAQQMPTSSLYRGCIQHAPQCIIGKSAKLGNKELLSGLNPVAFAATSLGVSLLAQRSSDRKVFFLGPSLEQNIDSSKVYTCSSDVSVSNSNEDSVCTVEAEANNGREAALAPLSLLPRIRGADGKLVAGQKRRRSHDNDGDDCSNLEQNTLERVKSDVLLPCNVQFSTLRYPLLHTMNDLDLLLLTDVNGCLYPRPYGTKLSHPNVGEIPPLESFGLGTRLGQATEGSSPPERVLVLFVAFQEQHLLKAVQSGLLTRIKQVLNWLKYLNSRKGTGKSAKGGSKGPKKIGLTDKRGQIRQETMGDDSVISRDVLRILHQRSSSNQNVLHVCCSNPTYTEKEANFDSGVLQDSPKDINAESGKDPSVDVAGLRLLLNDSVFAKEFVPMLKERDARGYTPFMTAIQCHNFKAAMFILDFVESNKDNSNPSLKCSMEDVIFPETFNGITPLHALAITCTENLPPSGLGNSLTVTNLPSSYTPRLLLKLFQGRYPSAYRATIPPVTMEGRKRYRTKTPKQRLAAKGDKIKAAKVPKKPSEAKRGNLLTPTTSSMNYNPWSRRYVGEGGRIPVVSSRRESLAGMVTFSDPKELRQALLEMDHHMVSSEMTAPEGGLASLVQHVLHVKLTEVENGETEKIEMEVGVRGSIYNVSNAEGTAKIIPKAQTTDASGDTVVVEEDGLICELFSRLLSYPEIATAKNKEGDTALAFLVNNSRWIKLTANQKLRLNKYRSVLLGQEATIPARREASAQPDAIQPPEDEEIMAEINITGVADPGMLESNLLAQLDDISSSFRSIVDTLTALERRYPNGDGQQQQHLVPAESEDKVVKDAALEISSGENAATASALISFAPTPDVVSDELCRDSLPVLIQLTQNWHSVASTVLGHYPVDSKDVEMTDESRDSCSSSQKSPSRPSPLESCSLDSFVFELLAHADEAVLVSFVETIINEMKKHSKGLTLETVLRYDELYNASNPKDIPLIVGVRFLRSVIRQLAVHLSRSGLSYVDLRSRLGSRPTASSGRNSQSDNLEFKRKVRMILRSFSWLAVNELVQAAEASVVPVREGVAKPQARSTGSSISNSLPNPNGGLYPGRFRCRPGIRVSGPHDSTGRASDPLLRTAYRIQQNRSIQSSTACRGIRLANITDETTNSASKKTTPNPLQGSPFELKRNVNEKRSLLDSDSDSEDDTTRMASLDGDTDYDIELDELDTRSVSMATGITHDHPYAWALDGRVAGVNEGNGLAGHIHMPQLASSVISPPSIHTGNCYLSRMFSRLVKETLDLMKTLSDVTVTQQQGETGESILPTLTLGLQECQSIQTSVLSILEKSWVWLVDMLDVVEGQLRMGRHFDTKRYLASLQRPEDTELAMLTRTVSTIPGASPEEYLMFLLRAHNHEHKDSLPVVDMLRYEHAVYVLDAFIYCMTHWPRIGKVFDRSISISSRDGEESCPSSSQPAQNEDGSSGLDSKPLPNTESKRRRRHSYEREAIIKFFGMDVMHADREKFLNSLHDTVKQKFPKVPRASWEVFTHNVTVARQKSSEDTNLTLQGDNEDDSSLPTSFSSMGVSTHASPLVLNWSPDQVINRWKISVDLFSRLFLADGPGAERESFLAARAGVAGRLARFRRAATYLRDSITNDSQQLGPYGGMSGRVGTTLSLSIKRQKILENTLRVLGDMSTFHYSNLRVKFEGEEGSGPGVNRGFFAAMANALKTDEKLPDGATALLHEPGKLPEQSGFYAPKPYAYDDKSPQENYSRSRRQKMFTSVGRFIGLSLWFSNTVPLNFSRHVVKFLLEREVTWEDLAFFNADLFEGLSRMILDGAHPMMTSERFQATYCCHFETSVGGTTEELVPGGSQVPVTPENICKYVRLYATKVMIGCVEAELRAMRSGLHDIIPAELLSSLTPEDFQLLVSGGTTDVDINRLRSVISFSNSNGCSIDILDRFKRWFWSIVHKMTPLQRQQLLYFCTGSAVLPALSDRRDPDQDLSITVEVISGNTKALPMATTCGQRMSIPLYPSKKILKRKLLQAIQCQSYGLG